MSVAGGCSVPSSGPLMPGGVSSVRHCVSERRDLQRKRTQKARKKMPTRLPITMPVIAPAPSPPPPS
eukprot:3469353-Prymnesium_polylepis.1